MDLYSNPHMTHYCSFRFFSIPSFPANQRPSTGTRKAQLDANVVIEVSQKHQNGSKAAQGYAAMWLGRKVKHTAMQGLWQKALSFQVFAALVACFMGATDGLSLGSAAARVCTLRRTARINAFPITANMAQS